MKRNRTDAFILHMNRRDQEQQLVSRKGMSTLFVRSTTMEAEAVGKLLKIENDYRTINKKLKI